MRRIVHLAAALGLTGPGLVAIWFLLMPGSPEPHRPAAVDPVIHPTHRPASRAWLAEAEVESAESSADTEGTGFGPESPDAFAEFAEPALPDDAAPAIDHEEMHAQAWDDLVDKLAAAGEDPERFLEAMEVASAQRWAVEEDR